MSKLLFNFAQYFIIITLKNKKMNKKLFLPLFAMALMLAGCMMASCSSDDNKNENKGDQDKEDVKPETKPEATAKSTIFMSDTVFNMVDLSFTYDGKTVELTKENTKDTVIMTLSGQFHVRKYVMYTKTFTEFPATYKFITKRHVKEGVDMKKAPEFDDYFYVKTEFASNPAKLWTIDSDAEEWMNPGLDFSKNDDPNNPADEVIDLVFNVEEETTVTIANSNTATVRVKKI